MFLKEKVHNGAAAIGSIQADSSILVPFILH